jgi:tRNA dimethylallyltransferase
VKHVGRERGTRASIASLCSRIVKRRRTTAEVRVESLAEAPHSRAFCATRAGRSTVSVLVSAHTPSSDGSSHASRNVAEVDSTVAPQHAPDPLDHHVFHCLIGPTAVGKSRVALAIAERSGAEIVSLDSMQVYRRMDVGTAKPTHDERARVRHHMLDLVEPSDTFDVQRYLERLRPVVVDARARGARILFTGGTGFYLKALLSGLFAGPPIDLALRRALEARCSDEGNAALHLELAAIDPRSSARIHVNDTKRLVRALEVFQQTGRTLSSWQREWWEPGDGAPRVERAARIVGLSLPVDELDRRIVLRTRAMLDAGWALEARAVRAGTGFSASSIQALGYRDALRLADGEITFDACARAIALATRQFARRQRTWYRKFTQARWLSAPALDAHAAALDELVEEARDALGWTSSSDVDARRARP